MNKNTANKFRYFSESNFVGVNKLFVLVYTNEGFNAERFNAPKYNLLLLSITSSSMKKTFMTK